MRKSEPEETDASGKKWTAAREIAGLSVRQLAKLGKVHYNTIYDLEKGDEGVTLRIMKRVANILGVTLGEIYTDDSAVPAERIPQEFRPLLEPLAPLTYESRVSIVRNIASNLRFMGMLYGGAAENLQTEGSISSVKNTIIPDSNSTQTDALRDFGVSESGSRGAGASSGKAGRARRRQHGKAAR